MMASWHLFKQSRFQAWLIRRAGAFSVYREGLDKQAISAAIDMLVQAERPLVIFPEGAVSRTNDFLQPLQEGAIFIARNAARRRDKAGRGKVVIHPVVSKYVFRGDLEASLTPVLQSLEAQFGWRPQDETPLVPRVFNLGNALITLKELRYLGHPRDGKLSRRAAFLIGQILAPLEDEFPVPRNGGDGVLGRVKRLSALILPPLVNGGVSSEERKRRWRQLEDLYLAQQLANYPPDYVSSNPTPERVLETVERFDEDLHDDARVHGPLHVIISIGPPIEVEPIRLRNVADPLMETLRARLQEGIDALVCESGPPLPLDESPDEPADEPPPCAENAVASRSGTAPGEL